MSTKGWRKETSVTRKVTESPHEYPFQQVVRLLERSALYEKETRQSTVSVNPVARFTPPASESIRFRTRQSLAFPSGEVSSVKRIERSNGATQWEMVVNLMGLTGAMGVMPYHYTELMLKRHKQKDETMEHFFDLFNHRTLSLFFQASIKYNLALQYERNILHNTQKPQHDPQTRTLLSLIGLGTSHLENRLYTRDQSLAFYCGLFSQRIRTSTGLQQILRNHFSIPVQVDQFIGQWQELIEDVRSRLPDYQNPSGRNNLLGRSTMLGKKGWFAQGKIRIILGPLNRHQLQTFAPGTSSLKALNELVRMYVGMEIDYEFIIRIKRSDIPQRICMSRNNPPIMGWNTWLSNNETNRTESNGTMDIHVSASRLV